MSRFERVLLIELAHVADARVRGPRIATARALVRRGYAVSLAPIDPLLRGELFALTLAGHQAARMFDPSVPWSSSILRALGLTEKPETHLDGIFRRRVALPRAS